MVTELILELISVIVALLFVIGLVVLGWLLVWKLFLARFKFVKELLSISNPTNYNHHNHHHHHHHHHHSNSNNNNNLNYSNQQASSNNGSPNVRPVHLNHHLHPAQHAD